MKTKLSLLISSIATIALVLAVALSQSTTNSIGAIHELTVTEMEAITGTGVCDQPKDVDPYKNPENGRCNVGISCDNDDTPCGTDYMEYAKDCTCSGPSIKGGWGCKEKDKSNARSIFHNCYCKDRWFNLDICKDDQDPSSDKARKCVIATSHWCN